MTGSMSGWRRSTDRFVRRLVSGVRSSWPASCTRRCCSARDNGERVEHPAERRPETAHLVAAGAGHLDIEPTGRPDVLGRLRQPPHRCGHRAGDQPAHGRRGNGHQEDQDERALANVVEHGIDLVEPAGDLHRTDRAADPIV